MSRPLLLVIASLSLLVPSLKTLMTVARRGRSVRFSKLPWTISGWWKEHSPFFSSTATGCWNWAHCSSLSTSRIASMFPARPVIGSKFHLWLPGT